MLWGISDRFQTLSLMQRQVAHALLTRPPLSCLNASRRINSNNSVRLECVMHAASVHPEPGSNSRKNYISNTFRYLKSSRAIYLSFTFCLSSIFSINSDEISICTCNALYFSLVVQFSMTVLSFLADSLTIISHRFPFVNTFFQNFQKIFSRPQKARRHDIFTAPSQWGESLSIILFKGIFVNRFLKI